MKINYKKNELPVPYQNRKQKISDENYAHMVDLRCCYQKSRPCKCNDKHTGTLPR